MKLYRKKEIDIYIKKLLELKWANYDVYLVGGAIYKQETKDPFNNKPPIAYELAIEKALVNRIVDSEDHPLIQHIGVKA